MTRWLRVAGFLALILAMPLSCRQLFTTSLMSGAASTGSKVSASDSTQTLLDKANSNIVDQTVATDILNALATKDISGLSTSDQTTILNLATTATTDMGTVTNLIDEAQSGSTDTELLVESVLESINTDVDLTAVTTILADDAATDVVAVDTLVLASATVIASVAADAGTSVVMDALATGDTSALTAAQQAQIDLVIDLKTKLQSERATELDSTSIGGFNLADLLNGSAA